MVELKEKIKEEKRKDIILFKGMFLEIFCLITEMDILMKKINR